MHVRSAFGTALLHPQAVSTLPHAFFEIVHLLAPVLIAGPFTRLGITDCCAAGFRRKRPDQPVAAGSAAACIGRLEAALRIGVARKMATGSESKSCAIGMSACRQFRPVTSVSRTEEKPSSANAASQ